MNKSESSEAVDILELLVRNPYNQNVPVEEFYRVINHFYGMERDAFSKALEQLDEEMLVDFVHNAVGDIESVITVTEKGTHAAYFLFPEVFYRQGPDKPIFCP